MKADDLNRFLVDVSKAIDELKKKLKATEEKLKAAEAKLMTEGEWSAPMTKKEMWTILNLRPRAFNTFARSHALRKHSRQLFQIRIDGMDSRTRKKFENR
jgi:hypothetical protein